MNANRAKAGWSLLAALSLTMLACGDGADEGRKIKVSGRLGTGLAVASAPLTGAASRVSPAGLVAPAGVTHIVRIPVLSGEAQLGSAEKTAVAADGSFEVAVEPEAGESDLLLLVNDAAPTLEGRAVGFTSLRAAGGADLVLLPLDAATRDLDLGGLSLTEGVAVAESSLETAGAGFSVPFAQLLETAFRNNLFKHVKNQWVNQTWPEGEGVLERMRFYQTGLLAAAVGQPFPVEAWVRQSGFNMRFDFNGPAGFSRATVEAGTTDLLIVPPAPMALRLPSGPALAFTPDAPLALSTLLGGLNCGYAEPNGNPLFDLTFDSEAVNGTWRLALVEGEVRTPRAVFDLQAARPFTPAPESAFLYYLPSFRITVDGAGVITAVDLDWYAWNPATSRYEQVADLAAFHTLSPGFGVSLVKILPETQGSLPNTVSEDFGAQAHVVPTRTWTVGDGSGPNDLSSLGVTYSIAGVEYVFTLFPEPR